MSKVVVDLRFLSDREEIAAHYVPLKQVKSRKNIAILLRNFLYLVLLVWPSKAKLDRLDKLNKLTLKRYQIWKQ
ncbi:unnamed protein product [Adineta steineri]|uniref:Uncharacterized protein n=1 Tax=Adineta steineri TaxID=433720 RepID=A0A819UPJ5_9BILA|nr:unnamed protein product [Adineta steineri]CAF4099205.1 unnamed protein product [Adineta steineri]